MANVYAVKSGNWSDTTVWNTGALPTSADDVYSNNFTVTVDTSPTVLSVRNTSASGITAGGNFSLNNGVTLTCTLVPSGIISGGTTVVTFGLASPNSATINGNVTAGTVATSSFSAVTNTSTGTLTINGNCRAIEVNGPSSTRGANNTGTGTLIINGDCIGGLSGQTYNFGANNNSSGTMTVTGNCYGGPSGNSNGYQNGVNNNGSGITNIIGSCFGTTNGVASNSGASNFGTGTLNITGNVTGIVGYGVDSSSSGSINITGNVTSTGTGSGVNSSSTATINITGTCTGGSSTGNAFTNSSTGTINHIGTAQASTTAPAIGQGSAGQVTILTGPLLSTDASFAGGATPSGVNPCIALRWFPKDTALSTFRYTMRAQNVVGIRSERSFYHSNAYTSSYPIVSNVRRNINYGPVGIYTGTMDIPNPQSVGLGVGVGTVTGTAVFSLDSFWNASISGISSSGSIGERIKTIATVATVSQQISDAFSAR